MPKRPASTLVRRGRVQTTMFRCKGDGDRVTVAFAFDPDDD